MGTDWWACTDMGAEYRYQELEKWLLAGIQAKRWRTGERLPSIRTLCKEKQLSKATVQHALQRLEARGLVQARPKAGYFVTRPTDDVKTPLSRAQTKAPQPVTVNELLHDIMRRGAAFDLKPASTEGDLPPGIVALHRSIGRELRKQRGGDYQYYDDPSGNLALREQLARHHAHRGWCLDVDELCMTSGCQHALFLALMATCQKGDVVAVESPGFYGTLQLLEQLQLQVVEIPTSTESGMDVDALEDALKRWKISACVLTPAFATPSGALMPEGARKHILALAEQYDLALIEDDIYADTAFDVVPEPLKAMDSGNRVILCGSFSKCLSRDLRLGWVSGARWHSRIVQLKLVTQLASSRYLQQGVANFMKQGGYAAHLRHQRGRLLKQRDQLLSLLMAWPIDLRFSQPQGGLAVWVELPTSVDVLKAYPKALNDGVVIIPGTLFSSSGQFTNCIRIGFLHQWTQDRVSALNRLPAYFDNCLG